MRRQLLAWCIFLLCVGLLWHEAEGRSLLVAAEGRQGTLRGQLSVIQGDDGVSYVSLDRLARLLKLKGSWSEKSRTATLKADSKTVSLTRDRTQVLVGGKPLTLGAPPRILSGGWVVPEEFLRRVLPRLYPSVKVAEAEIRPPVKPVRAAATLEDLRFRSYPSFTRVVLEASGPFAYQIEDRKGDVRVRLSGLSLPGPQVEEVGDGLVKEIRVAPAGREAVLSVSLEGARGEIKALTLQDPYRLVLDIHSARPPGARGALGGPGEALRRIVLDAGHGGHDPGAGGPGGPPGEDGGLGVTPGRGRPGGGGGWRGGGGRGGHQGERRGAGRDPARGAPGGGGARHQGGADPGGRSLHSAARAHPVREQGARPALRVHPRQCSPGHGQPGGRDLLPLLRSDGQRGAPGGRPGERGGPAGGGQLPGEDGCAQGDPLGPGAVRVPGGIQPAGGDRAGHSHQDPPDCQPRREAGRLLRPGRGRHARGPHRDRLRHQPEGRAAAHGFPAPRPRGPGDLRRDRRVQAPLRPEDGRRRGPEVSRRDGRRADQLRPITLTRDFIQHAEGSVLVEFGATRVICTASVEDKVPPFLRGQGQGWVTAEWDALAKPGEVQRPPSLPLRDQVAAASVGVVAGTAALDLDYLEDSSAEGDMNVGMTGSREFVHIQQTP